MMRLDNGFAVCAVPPALLDDAWPAVRGFIEQALQHTWGFTPYDVQQRIRNDKATLWVIEKDMTIIAAAVTEVLEYPTCKTLNVWILAGRDFHEWKDLLAVAEAYGRSQGCEWIEATGRPGLQRLLKDEGFTVPSVRLGKRLDNKTH